MDAIFEKLEAYGADIGGITERFLGDAALYQTCFTAFLTDEAFAGLDSALAAGDDEKAFEYAHTLKGITGNMGLTPLYQVICGLVEDLRQQNRSRLQEYSAAIAGQLRQLHTI